MKYINEAGEISEATEDQIPAQLYGTGLQGYVDTPYSVLVELFGEPHEGDGEKVDAEWDIVTPAGIAHIYNYKDGVNYLGAEGTPTEKIRDWHIGGKNKNVVAWIHMALRTNYGVQP